MSPEIFVEKIKKEGMEGFPVYSYGGISFPRYLVTRTTFENKMRKIQRIIAGTRAAMAEGTLDTDAGDTHGQYHNELAWYREQEASMKNRLASDLGEGLVDAFLVDNYQEVRVKLLEEGINPAEVITLSSEVVIQFGEDMEDIETITIVSKLDEGMRPGWVSIEAPIAQSISGAMVGETRRLVINKTASELKVLSIK